MAKDDGGKVIPIFSGRRALEKVVRGHCFAVADSSSRSLRGRLLQENARRIYSGQAHTALGARGQKKVSGLTMRDLGDCIATALHDMEKGDPVFALLDHTAIAQNVLVAVEQMMGIYPNVPGGKR